MHQWDQLPEHIIVQLMLYLPLADRFHAALTCKAWNTCFNLHYLWRTFTFRFLQPSHEKNLNAILSHGEHLQNVKIMVDQSQEDLRKTACKALESFVSHGDLHSLSIRFAGENPMFYGGREFISALIQVLSSSQHETFQKLDLRGMPITLDSTIIDLLGKNHKQLQSLHIINNVYVCKIHPSNVLQMVKECRQLCHLSLYYCSMTAEILEVFCEQGRASLKKLALRCRREEKYGSDIGDAVWQKVSKCIPELEVILVFDYTCPLHKVSEIMKPTIPVAVLRLETFTYIYDEVRQGCSLYSKTLRKFVLNTPLSRNSPELNKALVELAENCPKLTSFHVFCVLEENTVQRVLSLHPEMKERGTYTLKYTDEPAPWIPGKDCGEDE